MEKYASRTKVNLYGHLMIIVIISFIVSSCSYVDANSIDFIQIATLLVLVLQLAMTILLTVSIRSLGKKQQESVEKEKQEIDDYVKEKHKEVETVISNARKEQQQIIQHNNEISEMTTQLEQHYSLYRNNMIKQIEANCDALLRSKDIKEELHWSDYDLMCAYIDKQFFLIAHKLKSLQVLNEKEVRLCVLVLIGGFSGREMSSMLYYAESGIRNFKSNTAKKLDTTGRDLRQFILDLALCNVESV